MSSQLGLALNYVVSGLPDSLAETFSPLVEEVRLQQTQMDRIIIYCRIYDSCTSIYVAFDQGCDLKLESRLEYETWQSSKWLTCLLDAQPLLSK